MKLNLTEPGIISWIVFLSTLIVVLITLTSIVFPAFVIGSFSGLKFPVEINIFETGIWTYPLLITNFIVFTLWILYIKNKLPQSLKKSFKFIFEFEVSAKIAFLVIVLLLAIYVAFSVGEVFEGDPWPDFPRYIEGALEDWEPPTKFSDFFSNTKPQISLSLGVLSMKIFGNYAVIPYIASIGILLLTYIITVEISKKRFAGIVAMIIVIQSGIFLIYDSTITYPNFWVVFFILSLYTIYKKWPLSPIFFILSIPSKALSAIFLPLIMFFIYRADVTRRKKILLLSSYVIIGIIGTIFLISSDTGSLNAIVKELEFDEHSFWSGFTAFSYEFRFDGLIVLFLLPLTVGLFIASKNGIKTADSILVLIFGILLFTAILPALTQFTNNPYRFVPFIVIFAMGVGTLLSKIQTKSP